jgi:Putative zinc-binding metallo-peptidase
MHKLYRTLLGHFRHESGHYYWDWLVWDRDRIHSFRNLFGDERQDYAEALRRHYGWMPSDWQQRFVSAYTSAHPWEDWSETWAAHYLQWSMRWKPRLPVDSFSPRSPRSSRRAIPESRNAEEYPCFFDRKIDD